MSKSVLGTRSTLLKKGPGVEGNVLVKGQERGLQNKSQ